MHSTKVCRAWELVALSLDLEPGDIGKPGTAQFTRAKGGPVFEHRLDDLAAALNKGELEFRQTYILKEGPAVWTLYAGDFAAWASAQGWKLPEQFNECKAVTPAGEASTRAEAAPAEKAATIAGPGTLAEQWKRADHQRKCALAAEAMRLHSNNRTKAAKSLEMSRTNLAKYLQDESRNPAATVAPPFPKSDWNPPKR